MHAPPFFFFLFLTNGASQHFGIKCDPARRPWTVSTNSKQAAGANGKAGAALLVTYMINTQTIKIPPPVFCKKKKRFPINVFFHWFKASGSRQKQQLISPTMRSWASVRLGIITRLIELGRVKKPKQKKIIVIIVIITVCSLSPPGLSAPFTLHFNGEEKAV